MLIVKSAHLDLGLHRPKNPITGEFQKKGQC